MMRFFGYWTIFIALVISAIAAYYSIIGLIAIFAAAAIPVIVMGTALEVGKITSAVWLHTNWKSGKFLIKSYLSVAVLLLMFITSMGIFGFLSKAHIEQNSLAVEGAAQLERIEVEITRAEGEIERFETKIEKLSTTDTSTDDGLQDRIKVAEESITTVYDRLKDDIQFTQDSLATAIAPYQQQADDASALLEKMNTYVEENNIKALQGLVGAAQDGRMGSKTAAKVTEFRETTEKARQMALFQIGKIREASQAEILKLREAADKTIAQTNELINRLREQLGTTSDADVEPQIQELQNQIKEYETSLDALFEEKYKIEAVSRELEAEVGPVKYIAELVYGEDANRDALEDAVRWVILILVVVFDPLAIVLVIAGITLVEENPRRSKERTYDNSISYSKKDKEQKQKTSKVKQKSNAPKTKNKPTQEEVVGIDEDGNIEDIEAAHIQKEPSEEAIEFQGKIYEPTHYAYHRIKEQIEMNDRHREIVRRQSLVNKIVDELDIDDSEDNVNIVKKKLEQMFEEDKEAEKMMKNADKNKIQEVLDTIIRDTKKF